MACTNTSCALPRLARSVIRSQNIFRPHTSTPFNHAGFHIPGSRRTFLLSWIIKLEEKSRALGQEMEKGLKEQAKNDPEFHRRITNSWLYKAGQKIHYVQEKMIESDATPTIKKVREARERAKVSQSPFEKRLAAERKQILEKYPECNNLENSRWIWKRADSALDEGVSESWSKERRKEYYELQLQAVNIEALWNFKGEDQEEQFAWRERKRQEYEKILLQLEFGDGWLAKVMQQHNEEKSKPIFDSDTTFSGLLLKFLKSIFGPETTFLSLFANWLVACAIFWCFESLWDLYWKAEEEEV